MRTAPDATGRFPIRRRSDRRRGCRGQLLARLPVAAFRVDETARAAGVKRSYNGLSIIIAAPAPPAVLAVVRCRSRSRSMIGFSRRTATRCGRLTIWRRLSICTSSRTRSRRRTTTGTFSRIDDETPLDVPVRPRSVDEATGRHTANVDPFMRDGCVDDHVLRPRLFRDPHGAGRHSTVIHSERSATTGKARRGSPPLMPHRRTSYTLRCELFGRSP
jgi:hypothetical protein